MSFIFSIVFCWSFLSLIFTNLINRFWREDLYLREFNCHSI